MKKLLLFILIVSLQKTLSARSNHLIDTTIIRMDPTTARGGSVNDIYDSVTYIPLENSKECLVGEISKMEVVDNFFIICDRGLDQLIIFNKNGSFHAKCDHIPSLQKSPLPFLKIFYDFSINRVKKQIVVRSSMDTEKLYLFNYDGKLIGNISRTQLAGAKYISGHAYLDSGIYAYYIKPGYNSNPDENKWERPNYELFIANNSSSDLLREMSYDPSKTPNEGLQAIPVGPFYSSGAKGSCFFAKSYDYNIYKLNSKGISNVYKLIFPISYSIPSDFLVNEEKYSGKRLEYLRDNVKNIFGISTVYCIGETIFFMINNNHHGNLDKIFSYNLKTGSLFSLLRITPDSNSYFLPLMNGVSYFGYTSIQACDGENIYTSLSSAEMFQAMEATKDKHPDYNSILQKYFATQNRKSNPVIVQLKPKANL